MDSHPSLSAVRAVIGREGLSSGMGSGDQEALSYLFITANSGKCVWNTRKDSLGLVSSAVLSYFATKQTTYYVS